MTPLSCSQTDFFYQRTFYCCVSPSASSVVTEIIVDQYVLTFPTVFSTVFVLREVFSLSRVFFFFFFFFPSAFEFYPPSKWSFKFAFNVFLIWWLIFEPQNVEQRNWPENLILKIHFKRLLLALAVVFYLIYFL